MNHQTYREWIPLFLYDELTPEQKNNLSEHLRECESCAAQMKELEKMHAKLETTPLRPSDQLLQEARAELRAALRMERSRKSFSSLVFEHFQVWMPYLQFASGAAALLIVGILIGHFAFPPKQEMVTQGTSEPRPERTGDTQIRNVKFEDADAADGRVSFSFDTVTPMRVRGNINDAHVQKVLTYAVVNEQNPGTRLRAVNALSANQLKLPDPDVKRALIQVLKTDENPGVRKEALTTLLRFPFDEDIKNVLLHVLVHDDNAGLRVAAIKSVESENLNDPEVLSVLKDRSRSDTDEGIRWRAVKALEEVTQQQ